MRPDAETLEEGIDAAWLEAEAQRDPVRHAYALADLRKSPEKVRFVTLRRGGTPVGYLLIWYGVPHLPVAQWIAPPEPRSPLLKALPERPIVAVVPVEVAESVRVARAPVLSYPLEVMVSDRAPESPHDGPKARRLTRADEPLVRSLADEHPELVTSTYRSLDLEQELAWGAFDRGRLVALARAGVRLPSVWMLTGIFTTPSARGGGFGRAVTSLGVREAIAAGAKAALVVRSDNVPARRLYEGLGFRTVERRVWIDAGTGAIP